MDCYIKNHMDKFSDRPDRAVPHRQPPCVYREKISEPDRFDPALDITRASEFGRPDRKDRR